MKPKLGRPRGAPVRCDLDAATARRWFYLDHAGRLRWRERPGGNRCAGDPAGVSVTLAGARYRSNRIAVLIRTGAWPAAARCPQDLAAAVRGDRLIYRVPSPRKGIPSATWAVLGIGKAPPKRPVSEGRKSASEIEF